MEIILHRANPEGAVRADAALVKAVVGQVGLDDCKRTEDARRGHSARDRKLANRPLRLAQPDGGRKAGQIFVTLLAEKNAMNAFASDIDPKERAALIVVNRTFSPTTSAASMKIIAPISFRSSSIQSLALRRAIARPIQFTTMKT